MVIGRHRSSTTTFHGNQIIFRIARYATASTEESVFIIGGQTDPSVTATSTIAEYKDGIWKHAGNLAQPKRNLGSITSGSITMIVGGLSGSESDEG